MTRCSLGAAIVLCAFAYFAVGSAGAQVDNMQVDYITCEPIDPATGPTIQLINLEEVTAGCPVGYVAVVTTAPSAIIDEPNPPASNN